MSNFRVMCHDGTKYRPIAGVREDGTAAFVTNVIHGLVWWDIDMVEAYRRLKEYSHKYPHLQFKATLVD